MTITYDILFRVRVRHEYYDGGFSDDFEFMPSPSCQRLLGVLGFIFRKSENGFVVFARVQPKTPGNPPDLFRSIGSQNLRFSFFMRLNNPYFFNITNLPSFELEQEIFYFSNLYNEFDAGNNIRYLGDQKTNARVGAPINLTSGFTHNLTFGKALQTATIQMEDVFENVKTPIPQLALSGNDETESLQIDFKKIPKLLPGRFKTEWSGNGTGGNDTGETNLFFEPGINRNQILGVIEIYNRTDAFTANPAHQVPATHQFLNGNTLVRSGAQNDELTAEYSIDFKAHPAVRWHYVFQKKAGNSAAINLNNLTINNFSPTNAPEHVPLPGSRVLRSDNDINVRESLPAFTLNTNVPGFLPELPQPSIGSNLKRISGQTPFYELYYYV